VRLVVARVGRAHGLKGEVALDLRTDDPENRLAPGTVLDTDPESAGPLTVASSALRQGRWYVTFDQAADRTAVEGLRGVLLLAEPEPDEAGDAWYRHELVGLRAERVGDHAPLGTVIGLEHPPAHDLLVLREPGGTVSRVPFVRAIVPLVDVAGGRVLLDPPGGLLVEVDGDEPDQADEADQVDEPGRADERGTS